MPKVVRGSPERSGDGSDADFDIARLLAGLGFADSSFGLARDVLIRAGLTTRKKARISSSKTSAVSEALRAKMCLSCGDARCEEGVRRTRPGRTVVRADASFCEWCGGSANDRAARAFLDACFRSGITRMVVVGGSPAARRDLHSLVGSRVELRLIDGTARNNANRARSDLAWAQLVMIWGATQLDHRVSTLYTGFHRDGAIVVAVAKRGLAALLEAATTAISGRGSRA